MKPDSCGQGSLPLLKVGTRQAAKRGASDSKMQEISQTFRVQSERPVGDLV